MKLEVIGDSSMFVARVDDSGSTGVARYNQAAPQDFRIGRGDCIVAANDLQEVPAMLGVTRAATLLRLKIRRVRILRVVVQKRGRPLGLSMRYEEDGGSLVVTHIDGAGALAADGIDVAPADRIVSVNGCVGTSAELLEAVQTCDVLELGLSWRLR